MLSVKTCENLSPNLSRDVHHIPVMVQEVIKGLRCTKDGIYVDGTIGCGGHTLEILKKTSPDGKVMGLDWDEDALKVAKTKLKGYGDRITLMHGNFVTIRKILKNVGIDHVNGILLDLGLSSLHLERKDRGFSFKRDGPLDMRMDRRKKETVFQLVNFLPEKELNNILKSYGEERWSARIARGIVQQRGLKPINTTTKLAEIVLTSIPPRYHSARIHPATKTFQALRIYLNNELDNLKKAVREGVDSLKPEGRFCIVTYHSLEDRIVKDSFRNLSRDCICPPFFPECKCEIIPKLKVLTKRPIRPSVDEVRMNPRARSAKLRVAEKVNYKGQSLFYDSTSFRP